MPKKITIHVEESIDFLEKSYAKTTSSLQRDRIKTLLYVKLKKYSYQSDIGKKLGRTEKTIRMWLQTYQASGLDSLLKVNSGGNNTKIISQQSENFIAKQVLDPKTTITSYVELQSLLEEDLGEFINYAALYAHCRRKHKTKLKVSRKSHYKKDENAEAFFKKP